MALVVPKRFEEWLRALPASARTRLSVLELRQIWDERNAALEEERQRAAQAEHDLEDVRARLDVANAARAVAEGNVARRTRERDEARELLRQCRPHIQYSGDATLLVFLDRAIRARDEGGPDK